jgi:SAM-dependent methyltransferase
VEISDRSAALLEGVDLDREVGLEIGPLDKPVVRRKEGRPIYYADYTSREALCAKSADDPNVDVTLIPEIDYLIAGLPIRLDRTFDYILASHVIEHVPDLVGWLEALFGWLSPGGRVILAVPDKRYCFDLLRALSTTGQVIEAHLQRRERPGFAAIYGGMRAAVHFDLGRAWREDPYRGSLEPMFSPEIAYHTAQRAHETGEHIDCHSWVFTHSSFLQILGELNDRGVLPLRIIRDAAPVSMSNEFHVVLAPG